MTLLELAAILAFVVAATVYACWHVRSQFMRDRRLIVLHSARVEADIAGDGNDRKSREAWAAHLAETRVREQVLAETLRADMATGLLLTLLAEPPRLDVVA